MAEIDADLDRLIVNAFTAAENAADVSPDATPSTTPQLSPLSSISSVSDGDQEVEEMALPPPASISIQNSPQTKGQQVYVLVPPAPYSTQPPSKKKKKPGKPKSDAQKARDRAKSRKRRKIHRQQTNSTPPTVPGKQKPQQRIFLSSLPVSVYVDADVIQHSGYVGKAMPLPEKRAYSLKELKGDGFEVVEHKPGVTQPLLEKNTRSVIGWIAAGPRDAPEPPTADNANTTQPESASVDAKRSNSKVTWDENCTIITDKIRELRPHCKFQKPALSKTQLELHREGLGGPNVLEPRRGVTETITCGVSLGNGQLRPQQLRQHPKNRKVWDVILNDPVFIRLSGWVSGLFVTWAPLLFLYYANMITSLLNSDGSLSRPFANSVFSAVTVNFGANTVTYPHRDLKNLAFGLCAITAFGNYDWRQGGHLVLFDLKLVIEFPPGTTIFIPSSVLCHANTVIQPGEERYSVVMFSAGGLFRWVEQGFQAASLYWKTKEAAEKAVKTAERWTSGLAMFSTLQELREGVTVE
ncbi:hypothetical protein V5O48_014021 [Marasmius crinis-equi]|uniref:Uncharacterized protein n=1 Tax=Marasmius crinis-equi TaxID=585013 RepID=A0ABR3EYI1_9AGAR